MEAEPGKAGAAGRSSDWLDEAAGGAVLSFEM